MDYQIYTANEWVFPDTPVSPSGPRTIELLSARGARTACQAIFHSGEPGATVRWTLTGAVAEAATVEVYQMIDVMVEANTRDFGFCDREGEKRSDSVTRRAPFRVYDALRPLTDDGQARSDIEALYVSCRVPVETEPGTFTGTLCVRIGDDEADIPVTLAVFPATVPSRESLRYTNWFNVKNAATRHGLEMWSEAHWEMIRSYGRLMRRGRETDFLPAVGVDVEDAGDGRYTFDFQRMERFIRLFLDLGFTWINGPHVAGRQHYNAPEFTLSAAGEKVNAIGPQGYEYLAQYLPAWRSFLERNGWLDRVVQHVADEPTEKCAKDYRVLVGIVRKFMPGVPIVDALGAAGLDGSVDIWVPNESIYHEYRDEFERHRYFGDRIWYYTSCVPGGPHLNRLLDMHLLRTRYLHWANYRYDLEGFGHYGLNQYLADQDPFEQNCPAHAGNERLPPGSTHIVYPGEDGPWTSVRMEAHSMGIEDYELLRIVEAKDATLAQEIAASCLRSFVDFDEDAAHFAGVHRRLLEAASMATDA